MRKTEDKEETERDKMVCCSCVGDSADSIHIKSCQIRPNATEMMQQKKTNSTNTQVDPLHITSCQLRSAT